MIVVVDVFGLCSGGCAIRFGADSDGGGVCCARLMLNAAYEKARVVITLVWIVLKDARLVAGQRRRRQRRHGPRHGHFEIAVVSWKRLLLLFLMAMWLWWRWRRGSCCGVVELMRMRGARWRQTEQSHEARGLFAHLAMIERRHHHDHVRGGRGRHVAVLESAGQARLWHRRRHCHGRGTFAASATACDVIARLDSNVAQHRILAERHVGAPLTSCYAIIDLGRRDGAGYNGSCCCCCCCCCWRWVRWAGEWWCGCWWCSSSSSSSSRGRMRYCACDRRTRFVQECVKRRELHSDFVVVVFKLD